MKGRESEWKEEIKKEKKKGTRVRRHEGKEGIDEEREVKKAK